MVQTRVAFNFHAHLPACPPAVIGTPVLRAVITGRAYHIIMNKTVLIIEPEPDLRTSIKNLMEKVGFEIFMVDAVEDGFQQAQDRVPDVVLMNLYLNPSILNDSGLQWLRRLREETKAPVIVYGATINLDSMREVMRLGAFDFIPFSLSTETLFTAIERLLELQSLQAEVERLRREVDEQYSLHGLIGNTPQMRQVFRLINQVALVTAMS